VAYDKDKRGIHKRLLNYEDLKVKIKDAFLFDPTDY